MWLSGLSAGPRTKGLRVQFPVRAHVCVAGQVPSRGSMKGNHILIFLSLSFSVPSPLSENKINKIFLKKKIKTMNTVTFLQVIFSQGLSSFPLLPTVIWAILRAYLLCGLSTAYAADLGCLLLFVKGTVCHHSPHTTFSAAFCLFSMQRDLATGWESRTLLIALMRPGPQPLTWEGKMALLIQPQVQSRMSVF